MKKIYQFMFVTVLLGLTNSLGLSDHVATAQGVPDDNKFAAFPSNSLMSNQLGLGSAGNWHTYLGTPNLGFGGGAAITTDEIGNIYIAGQSEGTFGSPIRPFSGGEDGFAAKFSSEGKLQWLTFLGGTGLDEATGIAIDKYGNLYVTGLSFNSWGTYFQEIYVAKLNASSGESIWYKFFQGYYSSNLTLDDKGDIYVVGDSTIQEGNGLVMKLNQNGEVIWNTFLGGNWYDSNEGVSVDSDGNVYVLGTSQGTWGVPIRAYSGGDDAFVAKLNSSGNLQWNTFLGGNGKENSRIGNLNHEIKVGRDGQLYVVGVSTGTWGSPIRSFSGGYQDSFVAKLSSDGSLQWNTFLGGHDYIGNSDYTFSYSITLDDAGNIYVGGDSNVSWGNPMQAFAGNEDAFIAVLGPNGVLQRNTFFGGMGYENGFDIAYKDNNVYMLGIGTQAWGVSISPHGSGTMDLMLLKQSADLVQMSPSPIILVHGWNGVGIPPPFCSSQQVDPDNYFEQVDQNLRSVGYYVGYAYLESSPCYTPSLEDNVSNLIAAIDIAKAANPGSKVILIAHSMGGLVARAYIENKNLYRGDVAALFTFGSPHLGTPDDVIAFLLNGVSLGNACKNYQPAVCDFSVLGMMLFNMNHHQNNSVIYHAISGNAPLLTRSAIGMTMGVLIPGADDGIVPTDSGRATSLGTFDRWTTDEVHGPGNNGLFNFGPHTYFIRDGGNSTSYTECIYKVLVIGASNCGNVSTTAATQQSISMPTLAQHTSIEYGTLQSGQIATRNMSLEGGTTLFASQWQSGTLAFTLIDPNGQTINPAFATANPSVVTYSEDTTAATYYFPNPIAGTWKLVLQSVSVPAGGTTFSDFAAFDSNVAITGNLDKQWYTPGTTATITVALAGLPSSAAVTANILRSDNVTDALSLLSIGNGQYQASYIVPNVPGYAEVRLVATGTTASSLPFERGMSLVFQISPKTFSLKNIYTDTPLLYPGLSHYQYLNVTASINATISGKVGLSADLVDGNENFVAHGLTIQDVAAGTSILTLQFSGTDIFASQHNGPYTLTNILLTDESGTILVTQQAQSVYVTAPYLYTDFDIFPPNVTSIIRNNASPTNLASVNFTVTFSEPVTSVDVSDFTLTSIDITGSAVTNVSGSGDTYTVTVNTGTGQGTIRLDVVDDNSIVDAANNPLGGMNVGDGNYISGETYWIIRVSSFSDLDNTHWAWQFIERLYNAGITGGCSTNPLSYCPESSVTRAQMAVFLEKGTHYPATFAPSDVAPTFTDTISHWAEDWIEALKSDGITSGCGANIYCPENPVTRAQMAIFLLKAKHGSSYSPPAATGIFTDVPVGYWADKWIEQLAAEGITSGCAAGLYCPDNSVTRAQMAVFLVKAFGLP